MAVTITYSDGLNAEGTGVSSLTLVNFVTSGSNRKILVGGAMRSDTSSITSVVRGAETYTEIASEHAQSSNDSQVFLSDGEPATAATDLVANIGPDPRVGAVIAHALQNVHQSTPTGTADTDSNASTTSSSTTVSGGSLTVDFILTTADATSAAPDVSQTLEFSNLASSDSATRLDHLSSSKASGTTMTWSWTTATKLSSVSIPVNEAAVSNLSVTESETITVTDTPVVAVQAAETDLNFGADNFDNWRQGVKITSLVEEFFAAVNDRVPV